MQEKIQELPHLVVDEPKRSKWAVFAIFVLSVMVLAIPLGIYLTGQRTQIAPEAAVTTPEPDTKTGIFLESGLTMEDGSIPVNAYVKSPLDSLNLVEARIKFDPNLVSIDKIATSSGKAQKPVVFNKWLEASVDNNLGIAVIIAGVPSPGISSSQIPEGKIYLGTFILRPKSSGSMVLDVGDDSAIYRNKDNQNLFNSGGDLVLNSGGNVSTPSPSQKPKSKATEPLIVITTPVLGENFSYFKTIDINWSSFNVSIISEINLLINGEIFGPIAQNLEGNVGKYSWEPSKSLAIAFIQLSNTYEIEIIGISKEGEIAKVTTGPFGILGVEEIPGGLPSSSAFSKNQLSIKDASRLLSGYLISPLSDPALDFNKDEVINNLDFFFLKQNLLNRQILH